MCLRKELARAANAFIAPVLRGLATRHGFGKIPHHDFQHIHICSCGPCCDAAHRPSEPHRRGGTASDAARNVPEMERAYPECTMFHAGFPDNLVYEELALPAWGVYIRHADGIRFEDCNFSVDAPDARRPFVAEDVHCCHIPSLNSVSLTNR